MIKIGILGEIGSGKTYISKMFGYPVFNADEEVSRIYSKNKKIFNKLKKNLPKHIISYPVSKNEVINAILDSKQNLKKIVKIIHPEVKKKNEFFFKKK